MSHFSSLLDEVMSDTPVNQDQLPDPPSALRGTRRTSSEAGFDEGGRNTGATDQSTELSETTHHELAFAESSMDRHGLEGDNRDIVRQLIMVCILHLVTTLEAEFIYFDDCLYVSG